MITYEKVNAILQTLPIGYYIGRKLSVKLGDAETSFFNVMSNELVVSYQQVAKLENPTEEDIRCLLYHETSHALLTPKIMKMNDILNIFEDERIETICKSFYLGVNFKNFVKKVNNFDESTPVTDARQYFYRVVRFRIGEKQFLDTVNKLIKKYAFLNRSTSGIYVDNYANDVDNFYNEVKAWFESHKEKKEEITKSEEQSSENPNEGTPSKNESENKSEDNSKETTEQSSTSSKETNEDTNTDEELNETLKKSLEDSIQALNNEFKNLEDTNLQNTFRQILLNKQNIAKMNGSAINSYSGTFDYRSVARNDYKYFVRQNRAGNVRRFSKVKLNLFVDTSGSFSYSQDVVNKMLYNLALLEKQTSDFEFDVVSMSMSEKLLAKNERRINAYGGNKLDEKIFDFYKKVQDKNSTNINIVMFDGDAFSDYYYYGKRKNAYKNMAAFNHSNCIIISDTDNQMQINEYCQSAKRIIVNRNYAQLLIQNVVSNLQHGLK